MEQSKFKYLLSPENTYIIDFGDFIYEVKGSEIMNKIRNIIAPPQEDDIHKNILFPPTSEENIFDAGL
jgi:hypothetical protein